MLYFCGVINKQNKHDYKYMAILPITILNFYIMSNVLEAKKVKKVQTIKDVAIETKIEQLKKELNICQTCMSCSDLLEQIYFYEKSNYN